MAKTLMQYREELVLTVDEFAEKLGVTPRTLYRMIGGTPARPTTKRKIAKALGVPVSEISEFAPRRMPIYPTSEARTSAIIHDPPPGAQGYDRPQSSLEAKLRKRPLTK